VEAEPSPGRPLERLVIDRWGDSLGVFRLQRRGVARRQCDGRRGQAGAGPADNAPLRWNANHGSGGNGRKSDDDSSSVLRRSATSAVAPLAPNVSRFYRGPRTATTVGRVWD